MAIPDSQKLASKEGTPVQQRWKTIHLNQVLDVLLTFQFINSYVEFMVPTRTFPDIGIAVAASLEATAQMDHNSKEKVG